MAEGTSGSSKRRRFIAGNASSSSLKIYDLPIEPLTYSAAFLPAPSRAIFAAALTSAPNGDGLCTESIRKIAGNDCETLDFGDIEKELAARLSDGDIDAILRCVDAVNKLKILRLTNCINILGTGLESLRGSRVIWKIDLSLVGDHVDPRLDPMPPISCTQVLSVLVSIINTEGCVLKHLQFPKHWRRGLPDDYEFLNFLMQFNGMLFRRDDGLLPCEREGQRFLTDHEYLEFGVQNDLCYACSKHYCSACRGENYDEECGILFCSKCERVYCPDCSLMPLTECAVCTSYSCCNQCNNLKDCSGCFERLCHDCGLVCGLCGRIWCEDCQEGIECDVCEVNYCCEECASCKECEDCHSSHCDACNVKAGMKRVHECNECGTVQCISCRLRRPYPEGRSCGYCFGIVSEPWLRMVLAFQKDWK